ncbi:hypothetical protein ACFL6M_00745 [Candidatus Eisenbacteria bacterium]|uniref:Uncharacterized protein n=1 Tax=Eiseniibacteriota bacterium TaxID=2212470 RepID=A0ABV6YID0_UNCEI
MLILAKVLLVLSVVWTIAALTTQLLGAWGGGRRDYSRPAGDRRRGVTYSFTGAMLPKHKESVRLHPVKFAAGVTLHIGTLLILLGSLCVVIWPPAGRVVLLIARPFALFALLAGVYLLEESSSDQRPRRLSCDRRNDHASVAWVLLSARIRA